MPIKWEVKPAAGEAFIKENAEYGRVVSQLLFNRGLIEKKDIESFFNPDKSNLSDPFLFKDMAAAVDLAVGHIKKQNLIIVYGDYDADGVTATAVLVEVLKIFKAWADVYIPARTSEGYGLNKKAIDELHGAGAKLIITVDNGIRNRVEIEYAKSLGIDVIITDHHEPPQDEKDWPDCLTINPKTEKNYQHKYLAGVGVAYKFAKALISKAKLEDKYKEKLEEKILDLVAVGTVADCVSLIGENRILVNEGLKILNQRKRLGLDELMKISQGSTSLYKKINSLNIGWQISPRLNSAGRLDHANTAYELLITTDKKEARDIAEKLNKKNSERQKITENIITDCKKIINQEMADDKVLILCSPNIEDESADSWPEGVVGLVAGRLCEAYGRPVMAITKIKNEIKGSGRSIDGFDVTKAIEQVKEHLEKFGGHAAACGFTVKSEKDLPLFIEKIKKGADKILSKDDLGQKMVIEAELEIGEASEELIESLDKFEPFGEDNERPKFLSRSLTIADKIFMGADNQHVKFRFGSIWAVAFGRAEDFSDFKIGDKVDAVYYLEFNEFNGRKTLQMRIVDIKRSIV